MFDYSQLSYLSFKETDNILLFYKNKAFSKERLLAIRQSWVLIDENSRNTKNIHDDRALDYIKVLDYFLGKRQIDK